MAAEVNAPVLARMRTVTRAPCLSGLDAVAFGGEVAHLLEGVPPVAEVLCAFGQSLQFMGGDFGAILRAFEVAHLRDDLVNGAVDTLGLCVERVDETPQQALAFVGELRAIRRYCLSEDTHGLFDTGQGFVLVPNDTRVSVSPNSGAPPNS